MEIKRNIIIFATLLCICAGFQLAYAHAGKTDINGGHKDKKNVSELGAYHYHHGKAAHLHPDGICPYNQEMKEEKETAGRTKPSLAKNTGESVK